MASEGARRSVALVLLIVAVVVSSLTGVAGSKSSNISNNCSYTVWPGILSGAGAATVAALHSTGFELAPGESRVMAVPSGWSGRIWGRTLCSTDTGTGKFTCVTGDCGSGRQDCAGRGPAPPATHAQFTLDGSGGMDLYVVSLVDGFNLPMLVAARNCAPTGCVVDINGLCPPDLRVRATSSAAAGTGAVVACKSACLAFGAPRYCCTGEYGSPNTCRPSAYSELFKKACPQAFSADSVFTCAAAADTIYTITFCPGPRRPTSAKAASTSSSPRSQSPAGDGNLPQTTTPNTVGGGGQVVATATAPWRIVLGVGILGAVTAALGVLAKFLGLFKLCCNQPATGAAV